MRKRYIPKREDRGTMSEIRRVSYEIEVLILEYYKWRKSYSLRSLSNKNLELNYVLELIGSEERVSESQSNTRTVVLHVCDYLEARYDFKNSQLYSLVQELRAIA